MSSSMPASLAKVRASHGDTAVRVVVADDDPLARRMISQTLSQAGMHVVAEAVSGPDAIKWSLLHYPDVLVVDVVMQAGDGLAAIRTLRTTSGDAISILALSSRADDELAVDALRAGAQGYLPKEVGLGPLPRAVQAIAEGEAVIPRKLGRQVLERLRIGNTDQIGLRPVRSPLTPREWEVFDLLCAGTSTEAIAETLVLSSETVRSHVKRILRKLHVRNRADAVAKGPGLRAVS
jgi:DNA-binding NarL/FixJ family response regulator